MSRKPYDPSEPISTSEIQAEAADQYAAHQEGLADGTAGAFITSDHIAAQRQANRRWGVDKQPHGDE